MTKELTKVDQRELHTLAKSINDREQTIQQLRCKTEEAAQITVTEAILQGQELLAAQARVPRGLWVQWLKANCPVVKQRSAYVYMKIAANPEICSAANSIRSALLLCQEEKTSETTTSKACPDYLQSLYLCSRWTDYIKKHPIDDCPEQTKDAMRKELEPVARGLWPDRFTA